MNPDNIPLHLDADTVLALDGLVDLAEPLPISWWPQTWGWFVVALLLTAAFMLFLMYHRRKSQKNRYRVEALMQLDFLRKQPSQIILLAETAKLLKRVALSAWPRERVAPLAGKEWVRFLNETTRQPLFGEEAEILLSETEYRLQNETQAAQAERIQEFCEAAKRWIEEHSVSA